jgi:uncharacterized protein (TIGR02266 family)
METVPLVVPLRFAGGGLSMQTTSSRLGGQGAFVRCMISPKEGTRITVQLQPPGEPRSIDVAGVVTDRVQPGSRGKDMGFWVEFNEVDADSRRRIDEMVAKFVPRAKPGGEAAHRERATPRVPAHLEVRWSTPREFLVAYSENISEGGLFIATTRPPALHEVVELFLFLPDGQAPAKTMAQVVQCVTAAQAAAASCAEGVGVQFVGAGDEFRIRLELCMENLLTQA